MTRSWWHVIVLMTVGAVLTGCPASDTTAKSTSVVATVVDAACGQCQLQLPGEGCDLAVRIDGNAYYVDGTGLDDHGDAHAEDGVCNVVRKARVTGEVVDGRFLAKSFELMPVDDGS